MVAINCVTVSEKRKEFYQCDLAQRKSESVQAIIFVKKRAKIMITYCLEHVINSKPQYRIHGIQWQVGIARDVIGRV